MASFVPVERVADARITTATLAGEYPVIQSSVDGVNQHAYVSTPTTVGSMPSGLFVRPNWYYKAAGSTQDWGNLMMSMVTLKR